MASLEGEFDAHHSDAALEELSRIVPEDNGLVLDMSAVTFLDSAGISVLIRLRDQHPAGRVTIVNPSAPVDRVMGIVGLREVFGLTAD